MSARKGLSARFSKLLHRGSKRHDDGESSDERSNGLCAVCSTIGFDGDGKDRETVFSLGLLGDIKQRTSCPFCRLVLDSMQDDRIIHTQSIEHYNTHEVRIFRSGPKMFSIQPLPTYSKVLFDSEVKGFEKLTSSSQIDFEMIKSWLATCEGEHKKCVPNEGPFNIDLSFFRCIDVEDMCITPVPITSQYVALSYKWGDCTPFLLLKPNKDDLFAKDGLRRNWDSIPRTIRDTIDFVRGVGCRYVWIDQLCLIQDDDHDRGIGINAMDLVYEQAYFTILAGSGTDADSGLPGVREGTRSSVRQVTSEVLPGVNLVLRHTMEDIVAKSEYHHRGWTFQEYYLSRRKIIFIDDTIYFKCYEKFWQELEDGLPVRSDPTTEQGQALHKPSGDVYHLLGQLLNKYTTRELKMPGDYVFAMAGVCRRLADYAQCSLLFGIPVPALDWFLLFYPNKAGLTRRESFPSWAWSGWYGQVYYNYGSGNVTKWVAASTWITWYKREPSDDVTLVWAKADTRASRAKELFGHLCDVSRTEPSSEVMGEHADKKHTFLHFWTVSANFTLRKIDRDEADKSMWSYGIYWTPTTYEVVGKDGANCGFVTLDDAASTSEDSKPVEFILLSLSAEKSQVVDAGGRFFWVLMIEWDKGVAERKGIGKIRRDALASAVDAGISWKEITLA
ncbi:heterokaryon incompatibility protein-domain-containing protein [Xylaria bambusicola]|uniref:heterokaryon incompatibility protein-domain-containing protein n=1 Tax=Xylaria bambusicola TaxID=326684 RepID=UPI0020081A6A|nr:heterokaryon incompatibility protein-domain-containing protein [Xylaria bambusicola]KAI0518149.1 heterokaryon incompatibility protein-domain-containing protein [Xylaria bambusicola]